MMVNTPRPFDLLNTDLAGVNLIEASAGSGKTYTIAAIYLRLVVETGLTVESILVVTFTEAATAELKDRVRNRLREAVAAFEAGESQDPFLQGLMDRWTDRQTALNRLQSAIRDFDEAAIFTIHGFCMRMLRENAFESGGLFDTELMTDAQGVQREVAQDFWRRHFYGASAMFVNYAISNKYSPDAFLGLLKNAVGVQTPRIIPRINASDTAQLEADYRDAYQAAADQWPAERDSVIDLLMNTPALNRNKYNKKSIPSWVEAMDEFLWLGSENSAMFDKFWKFTTNGLTDALKKKQTLPVHPFFELCDALADAHAVLIKAFDARLLALKIALFDAAAGAMREKKARRNLMSFDDLLLNLHQALNADSGPDLAAAIQSRFKAALIDEFQDTDPIQYAIFKTLFTIPDRLLFLIGDPKQAIYRFRGADVFAYMAAKDHVEHRHTLGENWRSEPGLVHAVNAVFGNAKQPFIYDAIPFEPATPAENKPKPTQLTIDGEPPPPMQIWQLEHGGPKPLAKGSAAERIVSATAAEIARMIAAGREGRARINEDPLEPGDIAVLLRTHREAGAMQRALMNIGVPAVLHSAENLFDSREAAETETVISALAAPGDVVAVKSALATDMIGLSAEDIEGMISDSESKWEDWLIRFRDIHDIWVRRGFMRAFKALFLETDMLPRLMALPDGERRCTNLFHLAEILHTAEATERPGMSGLVKWLSQHRQSTTGRIDEHLLRLESDARAVRLITIHKSKGLEYPVVFCPFIWGRSRPKTKESIIAFHDNTPDRQLTLDLGSENVDAHRILADTENLAENLRLLYVALTRARNRCVTVWGWFNETETAAPVWVFHPPPDPGDDPLAAMTAHFKKMNEDGVKADLTRLAKASNGAIAVDPMPDPKGSVPEPDHAQPPDLSPCVFNRRIHDRFRVASFSSLTRSAEAAKPWVPEAPDRDAAGPAPLPTVSPGHAAESPRDMFSFPRGARPGTLLHSLFEKLDFTDAQPETIGPLAADLLLAQGFDSEWRDVLISMARQVLATPLMPDRPDFTLSCVKKDDRLIELEFYFPLKPITPERLAAALDDNDAPETIISNQRLRFEPTQGFMMGFMDLVFQFDGRFYLLDWKSNHLGDAIEDYHKSKLTEAMRAHHYNLQYYIYTLALDQYLRRRMLDYDYNIHFGGVFYLFLRGVNPEKGPDFGVFYDLPPMERIASLADALILPANSGSDAHRS